MKSSIRQKRMFYLKYTQLIVLAILLTFAFSSGLFAKSTKGANAKSEWFKVAKNTYVFRYQFYFTLFVSTEKGIIAFDPLSNKAAEWYVKAIREAVPNAKLKAIVYTHWHTDHATGANVLRREFGKDIPIIAHEKTYKKLKKSGNRDVPLPTKKVSNAGLVLNDSKTPIELKYLGYAHTSSMLIAYLPKQKLVFAVDFVNHDSMGWRDLPGVDIDDLISMQKKVMALDFTTIAFGHGRPGNKEVVARQISYYQTLLREAKKALGRKLSEDQSVKSITMNKYKNWQNYDNWFKLNVRGAYRFEKEKLDKSAQ